MSRPLPPLLPEAAHALSRTVQLGLLAVLALVAAGLIFGEDLLVHRPRAVTAAPAPPGVFRPTAEQWAGLKVEPVVQHVFRREESTDGRIAIDEDRSTPVFSPYSGRVTRPIAKLGDPVTRGAPLFAIDATEIVQAQSDLITALAGLNKAHAQLRLAEATERRQRALFQANGTALKDLQQAEADLAGAQNDSRSAEAPLGAARNRLRILGKSDQEIDEFERTGRMNREALVYAPISGTVTQRKIGLGQYISAGASDPVYAIGDLSKMWLIANVRETDAPLMKVGEPVEVHVLAYPDRIFKAAIIYVAPALDPATRRLPVRAEVENPDMTLKAEMFARFSIITGADVAAPAVPESAIVYEGDTARVWVAGSDGTLASRRIRVGHVQNGLVEVDDGLKAGEKIVTSGTLFIDRAASGD